MEMAYLTGRRIVAMVEEDLKPSDILTRAAFLNAIKVNTAIGGSTNAPPHLQAIARHMGVELDVTDWQTHGHDLPLLVNLQPAGEYLGESFFRAGGVPAVMGELLAAGQLDGSVMTATGQPMARPSGRAQPGPRGDPALRRPAAAEAGFLVLSGNLFDSALMKTSVISEDFRARFLKGRGLRGPRGGLRGAGGLPRADQRSGRSRSARMPSSSSATWAAWAIPGSAEVVNMQPPDALIRAGVNHLPTVGDGRQSGTSESPSILNASPEAAWAGGWRS
jgi:dihydroxyacid dehydratase/phosphogluconate dehydratase